MDRPLWQIILSIAVLAWTVQRSAVGATLYVSEHEPWLVVVYALQGLAGVLLWASLLWASRLRRGAIVMWGITLMASAALEGFVFGKTSPTAALAQILAAVIATAAFALWVDRVLDG
jgi:hypothetical protein